MQGSCGCGDITYRLNAEILNVVNCHCNVCRHHNGSAFSTYAVVPRHALEITAGEEQVQSYLFGDARKHFCSRCATPLFNLNSRYPGAAMVYVGTLSSAAAIVPRLNVWCESQLEWINDVAGINSLPQGVPAKG